MRGKHTPVDKFIALWVAVLYFFAAVGPLDALRSLSFRFTIGPQPAFAQSNANVSVPFAPGLNLFSVPVAVPANADTCFELLSTLGGSTNVESISRFNTTTQLFEVCGYSGATAVGENFPIRDGEGYQVRMKTDTTVPFTGNLVCPALAFTKGTNIIGVPTPPAGLSCFDLLNALGAEKVATSQGYNKGTGAFEACTFVEGGTPAGEDFPIISGEAYVVTMRQDVAGFNPNDVAACLSNQAPVLDPIGDQTAMLGSTLTFSVSAADPDCPMSGEDCDPDDPDQDALVLSVLPLPLPSNAAFNPTTGNFSFTPVLEQVGAFSLTFTARDGRLADSETITITVPTPSGTTTLRGQVLTTDSAPLPGVRLVLGTIAPVETVSQADGSFFFPSGPAGRQRLLIDGGVLGPEYATVPEMITLIEGADNVLDAPIFLLPLDVASADPIDPTQESIVDSSPIVVNGNTFPPVVMTVPPGAAKHEDTGELYDGVVHISSIPSPDLGPRPLPDDITLSVYIAVQPFGVKYDPPVPITFPNPDGFPVGSIVEIFGLNHDTGAMEKVGDGRVGADGMVHSGRFDPVTATFTPGGVVRSNSWHGFVPSPPVRHHNPQGGPPGNNPPGNNPPGNNPPGNNPPGNNPPGNNPPGNNPHNQNNNNGCNGRQNVCSDASLKTGDLSVGHNLVPYRSLGVSHSLRLEYHSTTAFPTPLVTTLSTPGNLTPPPETVSTELEVAGVMQGSELFFNPPAFCQTFNCPLGVMSRIFDATTFETGIYPATLSINCNFPVAKRIGKHNENVVVINQRQSPFGVGWNLQGLQRIHRTATGDLLLTDGDDSPLVFTPATRASAEIKQSGEKDIYRFVASVGEVVTIRMNRRSNQADGSGTLDPAVELRDSRGFLLTQDDDSGLASPDGPGGNALITAFTLSATDTYQIIARGVGGSRGPYHLLLTTASDTALVGGQISPPKPIDPAFVFDGEIATIIEKDTHPFAASVGTKVNIEVKRLENSPDGSGTLDPAVELRDSTGVLIATDDDTGTNDPPGPGRNALIPNFTLPATDTYSVVVIGSGQTTGPYEVSITFGDLTGNVEAGDSGSATIEAAVVSPPGEFSTLMINADGTFVRRLKDGMVINFDDQGLQTSVVDRVGNTTTYTYDPEGRLLSIQDPVGLVTTFRYVAGLISEIESPAGQITRFEHNAEGNLTRIIDPDGTWKSYAYDDRHLVIFRTTQQPLETENNSSLLSFQTDTKTSGSLLSLVVIKYAYDSFSGRFTESELPDGSKRKTISGQSIGLIAPQGSVGTENDPATLVSADLIGSEFRDGNDNVLSYELNELGRPTVINDPLGRKTIIDRDPNGQPVRIERPNGAAITNVYDDRGNLTVSTEESVGATTTRTYDPIFNQPTSITDPEGNKTSIRYDAEGNLTELIDSRGTRTLLDYGDPHCPAKITGVTSADGLPEEMNVAFEYDSATCNLIRAIDPTGSVVLHYDEAGNVIQTCDKLGRITRLRYDSLNRLVKIIDATTITPDPSCPLLSPEQDLACPVPSTTPDPTCLATGTPVDGVTCIEYDEAGNLTAVIDPRGSLSAFSYDSLDRLTESVDPCGKKATFQYDGNGNIRFFTNRNGQTIEFRYDAANRLGQKIWLPGTPDEVITTFGYDDTDNLTSVINVDSALTMTYDQLNRLTSASTAGSPNQPDVLVEYTYDKNGNRKTMTDPINQTEYSYDELNRLTSLSLMNPSNQSVRFAYDALSRRSELLLPNSIMTNYTYNEASQLRSLVHQPMDDLNPFSEFSYIMYDAVRNLTRLDQQRSAVAVKPTVIYTYDELDQLTEATHPLPADSAETFQYDAAGNRLLRDGQVMPAQFDAANRLLEDENFCYGYDANGNRISKEAKSEGECNGIGELTEYEYDPENQLIEVRVDGTTIAPYYYDGLGRRIGKDTGGTITRYVYDNEDILLEFDGSDTLIARYTHGPGIDEPLIMERDLDSSGTFDASEQFFYHVDGLGSITDLTDSTGAVVNSYVYDSFGNIMQEVGSVSNPYTYTAREFDAESGLHYYRARYYDTRTGRFIGEDPIGLNGQDLNLYRYVRNNPASFVDPLGLQAFDPGLAGYLQELERERQRRRRGAEELLKRTKGADFGTSLVWGALGCGGGIAITFFSGGTGAVALAACGGGFALGGLASFGLSADKINQTPTDDYSFCPTSP